MTYKCNHKSKTGDQDFPCKQQAKGYLIINTGVGVEINAFCLLHSKHWIQYLEFGKGGLV